METKKIQASLFKATCLEILDHLPEAGIIITKHGEPVAHLTPLNPKISLLSLYGSFKSELKVKGDLFSTGERWNAES